MEKTIKTEHFELVFGSTQDLLEEYPDRIIHRNIDPEKETIITTCLGSIDNDPYKPKLFINSNVENPMWVVLESLITGVISEMVADAEQGLNNLSEEDQNKKIHEILMAVKKNFKALYVNNNLINIKSNVN